MQMGHRTQQRRNSLLALCVLAINIGVAVVLVYVTRAPTASAAARTHDDAPIVHILGPAYPPGLDPYILTIHVGDSVVFENDVTPESVHSVVAEDESFNSPPLQPGTQWTTTEFAQQGSHIYHDPAAYDQVVGVIVVVPASTELLPTAQPGSVATIVAQARTLRHGTQVTSSSSLGLLPWLLVPVAAGLGGIAVVIYRKRQRAATKHR